MSDISPIGRSSAASHVYSSANSRPAAAAGGINRGQDKVELSERAQLLSKLNELPPIRQELVDRVRSEIANGSYETPDKLDAAMDALVDDLL